MSEENNGRNGSTWKVMALLFAGGLGGGTAEKLTAVSRADVASMIAEGVQGGPYSMERSAIDVRLRALEHAQTSVSTEVATITKAITRLETKIDVLIQR